jgi:hypothetical protein
MGLAHPSCEVLFGRMETSSPTASTAPGPEHLTARMTDLDFEMAKDEFGEKVLVLEKADFHASNEIFLAKNSKSEIMAIFKTAEVSKFLNRLLNNWDLLSFHRQMEPGGLNKRSIVTSEVARAANLSISPLTVAATNSKGEEGTLQKYLAGYKTGKDADPEWVQRVSRVQSQEMILLDIVLGMADRHNRNWMVNEKGDLKIIDTDHVLYLTEHIRWQSISEEFPQSKGLVEPQVAEKLLSLKVDELTKLMRDRGIPEAGIHFAMQRLLGVQNALTDHHTLESIEKDFTILSSTTYLNLGARLIIGFGAAYILAMACENSATSSDSTSFCSAISSQ